SASLANPNGGTVAALESSRSTTTWSRFLCGSLTTSCGSMPLPTQTSFFKTIPRPPSSILFPYTTLFRSGGATCDDKSAQIYARFDKNDWRIQPAEFYRFHDAEVNTFGYF